MQATDLSKYIHNPQLLDKQSVQEFQRLTREFPYFQSAHLLLSMASKKWDASVYQQSLKKTAILVSNRAHLFNLIHRMEDETVMVVESKPEMVENKPEVKEEIKPLSTTDHADEINILKAAELATEPTAVKVPVEEKPSPEETLEKEISREVVEAFVEKEILKTPELIKPKTATKEPDNFGDWLTFLKKNNGQPYEKIEEQVNIEKTKQAAQAEEKQKVHEKKIESRKKNQKAIIDRIIESNPGLIRHKEEQKFYAPDVKAKESLLENEHLVTETLARIYALQGNFNKAIRAYEILSLKYPQKSAYFASLIQKLKDNQ